MEARKMLLEEIGATLVTIAKDVKIQIEFNPAAVSAYRFIGYKNRMLRAEDFNDDKKDAGEIGAGHTVTALYELAPAGQPIELPSVDPLKYLQHRQLTEDKEELLTVKVRYNTPDGDTSKLMSFGVKDGKGELETAEPDLKFAELLQPSVCFCVTQTIKVKRLMKRQLIWPSRVKVKTNSATGPSLSILCETPEQLPGD